MGASIGVAQAHGAEVAQEMAKKYEEYKAAGLTDDEINAKMTEDYDAYCKKLTIRTLAAERGAPADKHEVQTRSRRNSRDGPVRRSSREISQSNSRRGSKDATPVTEAPTGKRLGGNGGNSLGERVSSKAAGRGRTTRRRSFDNAHQPVLKKMPDPPPADSSPAKTEGADAATDAAAPNSTPRAAGEAAPLLPGSPVKTAEVPATDQPVDSWDSVTQQPFCPICHMTFKSIAFYERHVKYSDLHLKAVKKLEDNSGNSAEGESAQPAEPNSPIDPRIEGVHYKLLYTGSKLFWRTQKTVDFDIFHHVTTDTIEVVAHDSVSAKDVNRLYLSYSGVEHILKELQKVQPTFGLISTSDENDEEKDTRSEEEKQRNAISRYVLQRLQMDSTSHEVIFTLLTSDGHFQTPLHASAPEDTKPVAVIRRRRTNGEEFEAEMHNLRKDQAALEASVEQAAATDA